MHLIQRTYDELKLKPSSPEVSGCDGLRGKQVGVSLIYSISSPQALRYGGDREEVMGSFISQVWCGGAGVSQS